MARTLGKPIRPGYPWTVRLKFAAAGFVPVGATFRAQIRPRASASEALAELTTDGGGLVRVSDTEIDVTITAAQTAVLPVGSVEMDVVRTDTSPDQHLGFLMRIPVVQPVTR